MWKRVIFILFLAIGAFVSPSHAQEPSNPYIYYFSDTLNAFIIERADGTDTRVLGDGLMGLTADAIHVYVDGPGWSPSGKWFAWTAAQVWGAQAYGPGFRPFVLSADGTHRLSLLDHLTDAELFWAPDEDVLFVASRQYEMTYSNDPYETRTVIDTYLAMIDVASETVVSVVTDRDFSSDYDLFHERWRPDVVQTNDGQYFIVQSADDSLDREAVTYVFDVKGQVIEKRWDDFGPLTFDSYHDPLFPSVSTAGWVAYPTAESFRIENIFTNEQHRFAPLDDDPYEFLWDATGQYALITKDDSWLLDCQAATLTLLRENWRFGDYHGWERPAWSPDSRYALLLGGDNLLYTYTTLTSSLAELPIAIGDKYPDVEWYWLDDTRAVIYHGVEPGLFIYDFESSSLDYIDVDKLPAPTQPRLSPDEQYLAYMEDGAVIYDRETATTLKLRPAYNSFNTFQGEEIRWHDSGDWLLSFDDALVAGAGNMRDLGITRPDGTQQRDLGFSWALTPIILDWLPPQVDLNDLPPAVERSPFPQPVAALRGSQWSFYADWSPDGRWLAAGWGGGWVDESTITIWEVATGKILHVFENVGKDERVVWPQGEEFVPELMAVPKDGPVLALSPDGRQSVQNTEYPDERWRTQVIDNETGNVLAELQDEWDTTFRSASFSPDGHLLLTVGWPYMAIQIWDTATWELVATTPNHGQAAAFSPDGTQLAVTASWDVQIWDVDELLAFGVQ